MEKFHANYRIPSARAPFWNYSWVGSYFVTICTKNRLHFFGEIADGNMVLSRIGVVADVLWHEIKHHTKNVELGAFVVMPNHIHGIVRIMSDDDSTTVETRHALSLQSQPPSELSTNTLTTTPVETRYALSLQSQPPSELPTNTLTTTPVETRYALSLQPQSQPQSTSQQRFQNQGKNSLSSIIGSYKSAVSKHAHRLGFDFAWQTRFHDHIIRNEESYQRIAEYIANNPQQWEEDTYHS
jgi:putative transposase